MGFLAAIDQLGHWTRSEILDSLRFQVLIQEIDCPTPSGQSRKAFLSEVVSMTQIQETLPILATETKTRINNAFSNHPAVETVKEILFLPGPRIRVDLQFRVPVLAINSSGKRRVVDGNCYLLPLYLDVGELPLYISPVATRVDTPGTYWNDAGLVEAASLMAFLTPDQSRFQITTIQHYVDGLVLGTKSGALIHWGRPTKNLATANKKRERLDQLMQEQAIQHSLNAVHDLRHLDQP